MHAPNSVPTSVNNGYHTGYEEDFFGSDFNAFVTKNGPKLEAAKKRWQECSLKEWEDGAQGHCLFTTSEIFIQTQTSELIQKYDQILNMVSYVSSWLLHR